MSKLVLTRKENTNNKDSAIVVHKEGNIFLTTAFFVALTSQ